MSKRRPSLQGRLGLTLGLTLTVLWVGTAFVTAGQTRRAMEPVFDAALQETAQRLLPLVVAELLSRDTDEGTDRLVEARTGDARLTYIVRDHRGQVLLHSRAADPARMPAWDGPGFRQSASHRLYNESALQDSVRLTIAEPLAHRASVERELRVGLGLPLLIFLPAALLAIFLAVRANLASVRRFRDALAARSARDLSLVPGGDLPAELAPVADALNALLERLAAAFAAERDFSANTAHELRTPLAAAIAQAQRLQTELTDPSAQDRARAIESSLKRLTQRTERLMQLARADGGRLMLEQSSDLRPVARLLSDDLMQRSTLAGRILLVLPPDPLRSGLDPDVFAIIMLNLVENALRHGAPSAPVCVTLHPDGRLVVANDGPIVEASELARLTQRFHRAGRRTTGSGIGLAIVQALAERINGTLTLRSPAGGRDSGFEATVTLPLAAPQSLPQRL